MTLYTLKNLQKIREEKGLTRHKLAFKCFDEGAYNKHIKRYEEGGFAKYDTVKRLADFLNVSMEDLIAGPVNEEPRPAKRTGVGLRLHISRVNMGYSQQDVADKLGISQSVYSRYERGKLFVHDKYIPILAKLLKVSQEYLLRGRSMQ